jgi:prolycopene isomerase
MKDRCDVIVIGAGLGGLSAAALLARAGLSVLAVEQQNGVGGYARGFRRGPYRFDPAVHTMTEPAYVKNVLEYLAVGDSCEFKTLEHSYGAIFPGLDYDMPGADPEAFVEKHRRLFSGDREGVREFWRVVDQTWRDVTQMSTRIDLWDLTRATELFPTLFRYRTATVASVLDEFMTDPRAKAACAAVWPYWGAPPSRMSFLLFALGVSVLTRGAAYCQGGFQNLVNAFERALTSHGGQLLLGSTVERIMIEDGKAVGVRLARGDELRAPVVIANADARHTLDRMVGKEHLPETYVRRLHNMEPSFSACILFTATRMDLRELRARHETFLYKNWDHEQTYRDIVNGRPGGMWLSVPTLIDETLAPVGEHTVTLTSLASYGASASWGEQQEVQAERMLDELEAVFPGYRQQLAFVECATPATLERYCRNHEAAIYGWANLPSQVASKRLSRETPVRGLYLVGHWTEEGSGSFRVIMSGAHVAALVLHRAGIRDALPDFRPDYMPKLGQWKSHDAS